MTRKAENPPKLPVQVPIEGAGERFAHQMVKLAHAIGGEPGRAALYVLGGSITLVIVATAAAQVALNAWNEPFYNAIERKAFHEFVTQLGVFFAIAGVLLVLNVAQMGLNQAIRLKLRELATQDLIGNWMTQRRAARISRAGKIGVNPDQRIHEDAFHLTELTTDLGIGLLQATLLLLSFIGVLWGLSRGITLHLAGHAFIIPGYMVWAALIYAATGSWFSWRVGRRLVHLQQTRYAREADFRVALVRGAEHADGVVLSGGEADEQRQLNGDLGSLLSVMRQIVLATVRLTWVTAGYGWVAIVFPIIVAAPGYFGGELSFGQLMMTVGAFNQVQQSLRWFVDNTGVIADWRATFLRVMNFRQALLDLDRLEAGVAKIERVENPEGRFVFDDLTVVSVHGDGRLSESRVEIAPGEHVLITGKPGTGKSTLFLAVAGLWNSGSGRIELPPAKDVMYLSQRPFLPAGSLRTVLTYSNGRHPFADESLTAALRDVGLGHLGSSLDRVERWDRELGLQDQQLLAFARVLVHRPKWIVSDEALETVDDENRVKILAVLAKELPDTAVLGISGRSSANGFYSRVVRLISHPAGKRNGTAHVPTNDASKATA